jgi:dienelactone hydrolase
MSALGARDVAYDHDGTEMIGMLVAPEGAAALPAVLLFHDAFGLGELAIAWAHEYAALGYAVFAADVWGGRRQPSTVDEIGPLIGAMANDRARWHARAAAALAAARSLPEIDARRVAAVGYCFGGSTALELLRVGADLRGVVSVHGGLDLLEPGWHAAHRDASVLVCTGVDDPMATEAQRRTLVDGLDSAGLDWQVDLYSGTKHAFTNPAVPRAAQHPVLGYNARSARRAWLSTERLLAEVLRDDGVDPDGAPLARAEHPTPTTSPNDE